MIFKDHGFFPKNDAYTVPKIFALNKIMTKSRKKSVLPPKMTLPDVPKFRFFEFLLDFRVSLGSKIPEFNLAIHWITI